MLASGINVSNKSPIISYSTQHKISAQQKAHTGLYGVASDFDELTRECLDLDSYVKIFNTDKLKIADLLEQ
jgi:hypothetical protein